MEFRPISVLLLLSLVVPASAQLVVDETLTPTQLVNDVLLGAGVTATNIMYNGTAAPGTPQLGSGSFSNTGTNLGLDAGIMLASGFASSAPGFGGTIVSDFLGTGSDLDLVDIAGFDVYDRSVLEFDFVATGDSIKFRYVFASCEYPDFVCGDVNDAFGFFLSGPGIVGPYTNAAANIALVPNTAIPITINTVNGGEPGIGFDTFACDQADPNWVNNSVYFVDNMFIDGLIYGGFTVVMEAAAEVQCGETYHIKIAISDASDSMYDSAVFLEAGSFSSTGQVIPELASGVGVMGSTIIAGCGEVEFIFERTGDISGTADVDLVIGGTSTPGVDYDPPFPAQLTFAPGETSQSIFIDVLEDGDGQETLVITIESNVGCTGTDTEFTFFIEPAPPLSVELDDITITCDGLAEFTPVISGGVGEYEYVWSTGEITPTIIVDANGGPDIDLTVSDACSVEPVTVSATLIIDDEPLFLEVSPDIEVMCGMQEDIGVVSISGGSGVFSYEWTMDGVFLGNSADLSVTGDEPGYHVLTVTDGCGAIIQDSVLVTAGTPLPIEVSVDPTAILPCGGSVQIAMVDVQGGTGQYTYQWTQDGVIAGNTSSIQTTATGWHILTVTDNCNGLGQDSVLVEPEVYDPIVIEVSDDLQIPCLESAQIQVVSASGGNGQFTYEWTNDGTMISQGQTADVLGELPTWYVVTVTDGCGASVQDSVFVTAVSDDELEVTVSDDVTVICPGDTAQMQVLSVGGGTGAIQYTWTDQNGTVLGNGTALEVEVLAPQTYTVTATDVCTNSGSNTVTTILPYNPQLQVQLPADMIICAGEEIDLLAVVSGGSGYYFIEWEGSEHTDPFLNDIPMQNTSYAVTVYDQCGASNSDEIFVQVEHIAMDIVVNNHGQDDWFLQAATTPYARTWVWDMGDSTRYRGPEVVHSYLDLEEHWVTLTVTTPNGCAGVDSVLIRPPAHIHFPNAFTPDGDGVNDVFGAIGHYIEDFELLIFDRWGELIFQSNDFSVTWDGSVGGSAPVTGVYVYKYRAAGHFFPDTEGIGHVTLLQGTPDF